MIKTRESIYSKGTKIEEIIDIIPKKKINGEIDIGFLKVVTQDGNYSYVLPQDLEPEEEVKKIIERLRNEKKLD